MPNVTEFLDRRNETEWQGEAKNLLRMFNCIIVFQKVDGSIRELVGTLRPDVLPEFSDSDRPKPPPRNDQMKVYDVESEGWRAVKYDKIISFKVLPNAKNEG